MYLRAAKTEAQDAGLETDGMASSVAKLRDQLLYLTNGKLDIQIDENNFKSSFQVLKELSEIWDEIGEKSTVTQFNILNLLGGKRNANVLSSILLNFSDAIAASETAANAAGSAFAENQRYLEGIEGKTKRMTASFQEFANSVIGSGIVKAAVDIANGFLNMATALNKVHLLLPVVIGLVTAIRTLRANMTANNAAASIFSIFSTGGELGAMTQQANSIVGSLTAMEQRLLATKLATMSGSAEFANYSATLVSANATTGALGTGIDSLKFKTQGLGGAFKSLKGSVSLWITVATLAISMIRNIVDQVEQAQEETAQAARESYDNFVSESQKYSDNIKSLKKIEDRYKELALKVDESKDNLGLANDEYAEFMGYIDQIVEMSPSVVQSYTEQGYTLKTRYVDVLDEATKSLKDLHEEAERGQADTWRNSTSTSQIDTLRDTWSDYMNTAGHGFEPSVVLGFRVDMGFPDLRTAEEDAVNKAKSWIDAWNDVMSDPDVGLEPIVVGIKEDRYATVSSAKYQYEYEMDGWGNNTARNAEIAAQYYYELYQKIETVKKKLLTATNEAGENIFSAEEVDKIVNGIKARFANASGAVQAYSEQLQKDVENVQLVMKHQAATGEMFKDVFDSDYYADFAIGLSHVFGIFDDTETKISKSTEFLKSFHIALEDVNTAMALDGEDAKIAALEELQSKYAGNSVVLGMIKRAIAEVNGVEEENAGTTGILSKEYNNLAKAIQNAGQASSLIEKLRKGTASLADVIPVLLSVASAWNEINPSDQKEWTDFISLDDAGNIKVQETIALLEGYIDSMIEYGTKDTEFAATYGAALENLKNQLKSGTDGDVGETISDAFDQVSELYAYIRDLSSFRAGDITFFDMLQKAHDYADKFKDDGIELGDLIKWDAKNKVIEFIDITDAQIDAMINTLATQLNIGVNDIDAFKTAVKNSFKETAEEADTLGDAFKQVGDVFDYLKDLSSFQSGKKNLFDMLESAYDFAKNNKGINISDLITWDEEAGVVQFVDLTEEKINEMIDTLAKELGIGGDNLEKFRTAIKGAFTEASEEADTLKNAIDSVGNAFEYMRDITDFRSGEKSLFDMIESAYNYAKNTEGINIADLIKWDDTTQTVEFVDLTETKVNAMIDALAKELGIGGEHLDEFREKVRKSFQEAAEQTDTVKKAFESISDAMEYMRNISSYKSGKLGMFDMLNEAYEYAANHEGINLSDLIKWDSSDKSIEFIDLAEASIDSMIDNLARVLNIGIDDLDEFRAAVKQSFEEAAEEADLLKGALDGVSNVFDYMNDVASFRSGKSNMFDTLQSAYEYAKNTEGVNISDLVQWDDAGKTVQFIDITDAKIDAMIDNLATELGIGQEHLGEFRDAVRESFKQAAEEADTLKTALTGVSDALTYMNNVASYNRGETTMFAMLENAYDYAKNHEGVNLSDLIKWDGDNKAVEFVNLAEESIDEMIRHLAEELHIDIDDLDAFSAAVKKSFEEAAQEADTLKTAIDAVSDAFSYINELASYRSGKTSLFDMIESAYTYAENHKEINISDLIKWDESAGSVEFIDITEERLDSMIDSIAEELGVGADHVAEFRAKIKESFEQAADDTDHLKAAFTSVGDAFNYIKSISQYNSGEKTLFDMLQSTYEYANNHKEINLADLIKWDTDTKSVEFADLTEQAIDSMIDTLAQKLEIGVDDLEAFRKAVRESFNEAANEADALKQAFDNISDAYAYINGVASYRAGEKTLFDTLKSAYEYASSHKEINLADLITWDGDNIDFVDLEEAQIDAAIKALADELKIGEGELDNFKAKVKESFQTAKDEADALAAAFNKISDTLDYLESLSSYKSGKTGLYDMLKSAYDYAEKHEDINLSDLITWDGDNKAVEFIDITDAQINTMIDNLAKELGIGITDLEAFRDAVKKSFGEAATEAESLTKSFSAISDAFGYINGLADYGAGKKSFFDLLQQAYNLSENNEAINLSDLIKWDGTNVEFMDLAEAQVDALIRDLATSLGVGETAFDDFSAKVKESFKQVAEEADTLKNAFDSISDAYAYIENVSSYRSGQTSLFDALKGAYEYASKHEEINISDLIKWDSDSNTVEFIDLTEAQIDAMIDTLAAELGDGIEDVDAFREAVKNSFAEAGDAADQLRDAFSKISDAFNYMNDVTAFREGKMSLFDMLQNVAEYADKNKIDLSTLISWDESGGTVAFADIAEAQIDSMIDTLAAKLNIGADHLDEFRQAVKDSFDEVVDEADAVQQAFSEISSAFNLMNSVNAYKTGKGTMFDVLEDAYNYAANHKGINLSDIIKWDGSDITFVDITEAKIDEAIQKLAAELNIGSEEVDEFAAKVKASFEEAADAADPLKAAFEQVADAFSYLDDVASYRLGKKSMFDTLKSAYEYASSHENINLADLITWDESAGTIEFIDLTDAKIDEMIDTLASQLKIGEGHLDEFRQAVKDSFKEAAESTDTLKDAFSSISEIYSYISSMRSYKSGEKTFFDMLQDAYDLTQQFKTVKLSDLIKWDGSELTFANIEEAQIDAAIGVLAKELGIADEQMEDFTKKVKASFAESGNAADSFTTRLSNVSSALTYMNDHVAGNGVGDNFLSALSDFYSLKDKFGNETWSFSDFFAWDDAAQEFVYKTDVLRESVRNSAEALARETVENMEGYADMTAAEVEAQVQKITDALMHSTGEIETAYERLTNVVSKVENVSSFNESARGYQTGETSLLDMLTETAEVAEELGVSLEDAFDFETMQPNVEAINEALDRAVDDLVESKGYSREFANELKRAARASQQIQKITDTYSSVMERAQNSGNYTMAAQLTYDDYMSMIGVDPRYAQTIEYVNGVLTVNRDKYNEVTEAIAEETAELALLEAAQRKLKIDQLTTELETRKDLTDDVRQSMTKEIEKLKLEARGYTVLANEISNATNQFERFRAASDEADAETYMDAQSAYKILQDVLYNTESELYGRFGNEAFQEAVKLLINPEFDFNEDDIYEQAGKMMGILEKYFSQGTEDNPRTSRENMNTFFNDLLTAGFATVEIDEAGKKWGQLNGTVEDIANRFGMTKDAVRAALQELQTFSGVNFDWEHIDEEYYNEVMKKAAELQAASDAALATYEEAKKTAEEARAIADEAKQKAEEAAESGTEEEAAAAQAEYEKANAAAEAAEKAAEEARVAAEEAANNASVAEGDKTSGLQKTVEELQGTIEEISAMELDLNTTKAEESTGKVADNLQKIYNLMSLLNSSSGGGTQNTGGTTTGNTKIGQPLGYIASAGTSDVFPLGSGTIDKVKELAQKYIPDNYSGNVDLTRRVIVPVEALAEVGWKGYDDNGNEVDLTSEGGWATLFTSTITAGDTAIDGYEYEYDKNVVINATPILADGTVLDESTFRGYIEGLLQQSMESGKSVQELDAEQLGLVLSVDVVEDGTAIDDAINDAVDYAVQIHELQEEWDNIRFENNFFGEADTLDPNGVIESFDTEINAANDDLTSLKNSGADGVDVDTEAGTESVNTLTASIESAESEVYALDGSDIGLDVSPAISNLQVLSDSLSIISTQIDNINKKSIKVSNSSGDSNASQSGTSGAIGIHSAPGGRALVGEFGQEMVVDVNSGRWYTVGNNGPEFVNLPRRAIVYDARKTAELLGKRKLDLSGLSFAAGTKANSSVKGTGINVDALSTPVEKAADKVSGSISDATETLEDKLDAIKEAYELANETLEHLIQHEEFKYFKAERAANYDDMHTYLANEIEIYKAIMKNSQEGIRELEAAGATDGDEALQDLEEAYWSAYRSMYEVLDNIRSLYKDALTDEVDNIQNAFSNLSEAAEQYNATGNITIDTFQSLIDGGVEYLGLLMDENGQFAVSEDAVRNLLKMRKEQLGIETAIAYVDRLSEALRNGEVQQLNQMLDATGQIGRSTWDLVYANLELLKAQGLSDEQYQKALENIENLRTLTNVAMDDFGATDQINEAKNAFEEFTSQIEHYIAHQEFNFGVSERAYDFIGMNQALENEIGYYKQIMDEAQATITEMTQQGADDTNEALQAVEESYWSAYNSMYSVLDKLRQLRVDALTDRLNGLTGAMSNLKTAADEYNKAGGISLSTFQNLLKDGFSYMSLLDEQNGKYVIAKDRINDYIKARKNQLAIESALSYISQVREALEKKETEKLTNLLTTMDAVSNSTWDYVYAQAALLKTQGLSNAQYEALIANLKKMQTLADSVVEDVFTGEGDITAEYEKQRDAMQSILEYVEELIRAETQRHIDAINEEIEAYKKIVDLKKESLDATKKENEYQENVSEKVKEIAELQAKADLLSLDTSRSAAVERQKILQQIEDAQKDLNKIQSDYSFDAQKEALDKEAEAYEESRQDEIKALEASISSEEKVYQLAIERIRTSWGTLYDDLIAWNTEEGSVINQEITDAWNAATEAVKKYGSAIAAIRTFDEEDAEHLVVADIKKYHGGGIVGDEGSLNENEVLAVLQKDELVLTKPMKQAVYTAIDFVKSISERLGVGIDRIRSFAVSGLAEQMTPACATPDAVPVTQTNNINFSPNFHIEFNGADIGNRDAQSLGRDIADAAANDLFEAFSRRGINAIRTLRQ